MSIFNFMKRLDEDALAAVTTGGNPSVAYLPGGFSTMKNMLMSLNPIKKQWGLEVLEEEGNYKIQIEDAFNIIVPKKAYEEFNKRVYNVIGRKYLNLEEMINEARTEEVHLLYDKLTKVLLNDLKKEVPVAQTITMAEHWLKVFPQAKFLPLTSALISLEDYDAGVKKLVARIKNIYGDDIGTLEMLITALEDGRPLNAFEPFSEYEYIVGAKIETEYDTVTMVVELTTNMTMMTAGSLYVESKETLAELEAYRTVKVVKNIVFPVGMMFKPSDFNTVKNVIDELGDIQ